MTGTTTALNTTRLSAARFVRGVEYRIENASGAFFEIDGSGLRQARPRTGGQAQCRLPRNDEFEQISVPGSALRYVSPVAVLARNDAEL